jgi:hypothetical protein
MSDPLFEALRASAEAPDARLAARSETEATAAFLAAHGRIEPRRIELTAWANAPISRIFGAFAVAAVVVLYGGWALVAAGGIYR